MPKKLIQRSIVITLLLLGTKESLLAASAVEVAAYENADKRLNALKKLITDASGHSEQTCLARVNDFFNQVPYASDQKNWGCSDYWATPTEMLERGKADCEDYAIAKFFTLLELGIPEKKLFLTYVLTDNLATKHMVLVYYKDETSVPLILDNRHVSIVPETLGTSYMPLYRFNRNHAIAYNHGYEHKTPLERKKVPKWENLTKRIIQAKS